MWRRLPARRRNREVDGGRGSSSSGLLLRALGALVARGLDGVRLAMMILAGSEIVGRTHDVTPGASKGVACERTS